MEGVGGLAVAEARVSAAHHDVLQGVFMRAALSTECRLSLLQWPLVRMC